RRRLRPGPGPSGRWSPRHPRFTVPPVPHVLTGIDPARAANWALPRRPIRPPAGVCTFGPAIAGGTNDPHPGIGNSAQGRRRRAAVSRAAHTAARPPRLGSRAHLGRLLHGGAGLAGGAHGAAADAA